MSTYKIGDRVVVESRGSGTIDAPGANGDSERGTTWIVLMDATMSTTPFRESEMRLLRPEDGPAPRPSKQDRAASTMSTAQLRRHIFDDINEERAFQNEKYGGAQHDAGHTINDWVGFIKQHADKANQAAFSGNLRQARKHMLEVASLGVAALESLDRLSESFGEPRKK